jgi:thiamine-phosphate pyrophosphorylase
VQGREGVRSTRIGRPALILVTDPAFGDDVIEARTRVIAAALPRGALAVHLRDGLRAKSSMRLFAARLRRLTKSLGARLVVNGDPYIARDVGADGVHLGRGGPQIAEARAVYGGAWVSVAAHSDADVERALREGADAVLVSPVFATRPPSPFAPEKSPRGLDALRSARALAGARLAIYALGGVTAENAAACVKAGADGLAGIRALLGVSDATLLSRVSRLFGDATAGRW